MPTSASRYPLHDLFLGPHGEHGALLRRLIDTVLDDHVSWRTAGQPADAWPDTGPAVNELAAATTELGERLRGTYPFPAQHWAAHQQSDVMLGSVLGVLAGTLGNGNIVSSESSPAGIALEFEATRQVLEMLGYPLPPLPYHSPADEPAYRAGCEDTFAWAHLLSGGSAANLEALWLARLVTYLPIRVRAIAEHLNLQIPVSVGANHVRSITTVDTPSLLGLSSENALRTLTELQSAVLRERTSGTDEARQEQAERIVADALGSSRAADAVRAAISASPPVILAPGTAHYSIRKSADVLGIDRDAVWVVDVNQQFRLDLADLERNLDRAEREGRTVVAVVAVIGTTEEGAVDPLRGVLELRARRPHQFWVHADAAWGGYLTSLLRPGRLDEAIADARNALAVAGIDHSESSDAGWLNVLCADVDALVHQLEPDLRAGGPTGWRSRALTHLLPGVEQALLTAPDAGLAEEDRARAVKRLTDFRIQAADQLAGTPLEEVHRRARSAAPDQARQRFVSNLGLPDHAAEHLYEQLTAIAEADSITIDPHKLGHTAYPAGMVCFRHDQVRDVMAVRAPYISLQAKGVPGTRRVPLVHNDDDGSVVIDSPNAWTLEGSRPASAAASLWLTHRVLPLRRDGHGRLMAGYLRQARRLWEKLGTIDFGNRKIIPFMPDGPDSNLVLFTGWEAQWAPTFSAVNTINTELLGVLQQPGGGWPSVRPPRGQAFLSQTKLGAAHFPFSSFAPVLAKHGLVLDQAEYESAGGPDLTVLRVVVADPYVGALGADADPVDGLVEAISDALMGVS